MRNWSKAHSYKKSNNPLIKKNGEKGYKKITPLNQTY
jgi:hypothetical protein